MIGKPFKRVFDDSGAADTDVDNGLAFADPVESACHKRIVFHGIGEDNEFCAADPAFLRGQCRSLTDDAAHHGDGVHIQTGACGADVYTRADVFRGAQRFGNGTDQFLIRDGHALMHKSGKTSDEIDPDRIGGTLHCVREEGIVFCFA